MGDGFPGKITFENLFFFYIFFCYFLSSLFLKFLNLQFKPILLLWQFYYQSLKLANTVFFSKIVNFCMVFGLDIFQDRPDPKQILDICILIYYINLRHIFTFKKLTACINTVYFFNEKLGILYIQLRSSSSNTHCSFN